MFVVACCLPLRSVAGYSRTSRVALYQLDVVFLADGVAACDLEAVTLPCTSCCRIFG